MANLEQPKLFISPPAGEEVINSFTALLEQEIPRQAIVEILSQTELNQTFLPELNVSQIENPKGLPTEELVIAARGIINVIRIKEAEAGLKLNFDSSTWTDIDRDPRFQRIMADKRVAGETDKKLSEEEALDVALIKLGHFVCRFVDYHPIKSQPELKDLPKTMHLNRAAASAISPTKQTV